MNYFLDDKEKMLELVEMIRKSIIDGGCLLSVEPIPINEIEHNIHLSGPQSMVEKSTTEFKLNFELTYKNTTSRIVEKNMNAVELLLAGVKV